MEAIQIEPLVTFDMREILPLYQSVGWTNYTDAPAMLENALWHSLCVLAARKDGALVGALRAVGDGHSILYVQDLLVLPAFQRQGIGRRLLAELEARYPHVYQTVLLTDDTPASVAFYEACGFTRAAAQGCSAFLKIR